MASAGGRQRRGFGVREPRIRALGGGGNRERSARIGAGDVAAAHVARQNAHLAGKIDGGDLDRAVVVVLKQQLPAVAGPLRIGGVAVERRRERMRVRAVAVHDIELGCLITQTFVVEAQVGDVLAVGRNDRVVVRPAPIGERSNRIVGQDRRGRFRCPAVRSRRRRADSRVIKHALAVRIECRGALVVEIAVGELADRAAVGADNEKLAEDVGQITLAVDPEHHPVDELGRIGPFGVLRRFGQFHFQRLALGRHRHGEGEPAAVVRPRQAARRFGEIADRRGRAALGPVHEELRRSVRVLSQIRQARAVGRPARRSARRGARQRPRMLAVGADQPDDAARPVRLDVETHAHIGDAAPVGGDCGIADPLQIEDIERLQRGFRGLRKARRRQRRSAPGPRRPRRPVPRAFRFIHADFLCLVTQQ